jgi:hypothetical protein
MMKTTDDFFESKALHVIGPNGNPLKVTMSKDLNGRYIATVHGKSGKTLPGGAGKTPKEALARTQKMISGTPKRVKWANESNLDEARNKGLEELGDAIDGVEKAIVGLHHLETDYLSEKNRKAHGSEIKKASTDLQRGHQRCLKLKKELYGK